MLLNKIQQAEDFQEVSKIPMTHLNETLQNASLDVVEIILSTVRSLCWRLNLTAEETTDLLEKIRGGNMGYLWENMEKMDIQLERRNTAEQRERAEIAEQKAEVAEQKAGAAEQENLNLYHILIKTYRNQGMGKEEVREQLCLETGQKKSKIDELLAKFWEAE